MAAAIGALAATVLSANAAHAATIAVGDTESVTVLGTASVYQVFGHSGSPGGGGASTDAQLLEFSAAAGNVFTFDASGLVGCCGGGASIPPDGGGVGMSVTGANGLSSLSGNANIPLVGVFTTDVDPFGGAAPSALSFDANNPLSLSPLLHQVFYIGDGHAGRDNGAGALLTFAAPTDATRLYLGAIDAFGFNNLTGYYADNPGSFSVRATLANNSDPGGVIPEPGTWALMILGFGAAGAALRTRRMAAA